MMKKIILIKVLIFASLVSWGKFQTLTIKIGEKVPENFWTATHKYFINGAIRELDLSSFKGKFILIDFWGTWCAPCVQSLPEQSRLLDEFKGRFEILRVSRESAAAVTAFGASVKNPLGKQLTSIVADTLLNAMFPHKVLPHAIWIDQGGTVRNITDGNEVNAVNIDLALRKVFSAPAVVPITADVPLFTNINPKNMLAFNMILKGEIPGLGSGNEKRENSVNTGLLIKNSTLKWVYSLLAQNRYDWFYSQRMLLDFKDTEAFVNKGLGKKNLWTVDFWVPKGQEENLPRLMMDFANGYSGYRAGAKSIDAECYVLNCLEPDAGKYLKTKGGKSSNNLFYPGGRMVNQPIAYFIVKLLGRRWISLPVVDETGISYKVDMDVPVCDSVDELNRHLQKYGLVLSLSSRNMEMLVVERTNGANNSDD